MKMIFIISFFIVLFSSVFSQQIELNSAFSESSDKNLNNSFSYGIGLNNSISKNFNLGITINYINLNKSFDDSYWPSPDSDPSRSYLFSLINNYKILSLNPYIEKNIYKTTKIKFYFGTNSSINYFNTESNKQGWYIYRAYDTIVQKPYTDKSTFQSHTKNIYWKYGLGCFIKAEINNFILPSISLNFKINPVFIFLRSKGESNIPFAYFLKYFPYSVINFQFGISYKLKSNKK